MKKIFIICFFSINYLLISLLFNPTLNKVYAEVRADGEVCDPATDTCSDPNGRCDTDPNGDGTRTICQTPPLSIGASCKTSEDRCALNQICSPNSTGSEDGTCKTIEEGTACNPDLKLPDGNPASCGSYVNSPYTCLPDATRGGNTCQSSGCDPMDIGYECEKESYYCVAEKGAAPTCKFLGGPPKLPPPPGGPCAEGQMDQNAGKCKGVYTALGLIATDPGKFISSIFSILLAGSGAIALLLIMRAGYKIMTSEGKPESLKEGKDQLIAAVVGLIFLVFAFVFLELIGVDILRLPGFGGSAKIPISKGGACTIGESICADNRTCYNKDNDKKGQPGTCQ